MPAALCFTGSCQICDQPAHGRHFEVVSCRACAAFFRRAGAKNAKSQDILCQRGNCVIFEDGQYRCKTCRLEKCLNMGMDSSKFQINRDPIFVPSCSTTPQSLANFLGRPEFILCCEPDRRSPIKISINCSDLIIKARAIFLDDPIFPTPYQFDNSLERLTFAMEFRKSKKASQNLSVVPIVGKLQAIYSWEQNFLEVAHWFSQFTEFRELPMKMKLEILKSAWVVWLRLQKNAETAECRRKQEVGENIHVWADKSCLNIKEMEIDVSWCTKYSFGQIKALMVPDENKYWRHPMEVLYNLNPTNTELNFMLIQLCLSDALKKLPSESHRIVENLLEIQENNLHDYYTRKMKNPNYSGRLAKMMNVVNLLEADARYQREKVHLATVFDVFSFEFSHPEMFEMF